MESLVRRERPGIAERRVQYLYRQAPTRSRQLVNELQELYEGRCQVCLWDPRVVYSEELCHGHHIQWLSRGGADDLKNMLLVCPNHHAAIHQCDAPLDWGDWALDFEDHREALRLNLHLG